MGVLCSIGAGLREEGELQGLQLINHSSFVEKVEGIFGLRQEYAIC